MSSRLRASQFVCGAGHPRRSLFSVLLLSSAIALSGCASARQSRSDIVRTDLQDSARIFTQTAEVSGWTHPQAGAMSVLLSGSDPKGLTPTDAYLQSKGSLDGQALSLAVIRDLDAASTHAESLASLAEACLTTTRSDPAGLRQDLTAIERTLILAKRVRMVLSSAVERVRLGMSPRDVQVAQAQLANLEAQIDRLDAAADRVTDAAHGV